MLCNEHSYTGARTTQKLPQDTHTHIQTNKHTNTQHTYILTQDLMLSNEYLYRGARNTEKLTSKGHTHIQRYFITYKLHKLYIHTHLP